MGFFTRLLDILFPPKDSEVLVRETTLAQLGRLISVEEHRPGHISLLPFRAPSVRALITQAKFFNNPKAQKLLATVLRDYLDARSEEGQGFSARKTILVPVPLSTERKRERGYNQIERVLAQALSGQDAPVAFVPHLLERTRDTKPQTSLNRAARKRNMEGAFRATEALESGFIYIVVDDVTTTGATLEAAVSALRGAGAVHVEALALAH